MLTNVKSAIKVYGSATESEFATQLLNDIENDTVTSGARITYDIKSGSMTYKAAENTVLIISADVVDKDMNYIADLDDLVEDALLKWEMFISKYKLKEVTQ